MEHIDVFLLCRLYTHKDITYTSKAWASRDEQYEAFVDLHKNRDKSYDAWCDEEIPFQESHNLVHNPDKGPKPWYS